MKNSNSLPTKYSIVFAGDSEVGKTSIIRRFTEDTFEFDTFSTIGIDMKYKSINVDGTEIKLKIIDTAGQEKFKTLTKNYYRSGDGIIFVYDISSKISFDSVNNWINEAKVYNCNQLQPMILVGNKCDCSNREVTYEMGRNLADEKKMNFYETSAKMNLYINELFSNLAQKITTFKKNLDCQHDKDVKIPPESHFVIGNRTRTNNYIKKKWC